jgi:AraC-like DNA-binding protein
MDIPGEGSGYFTFADGWLIEVVSIDEGEYFFYSDEREVRPSGRQFGVYYPPFTMVQACSRNLKGGVFGIGSTEKPAGLPDRPVIFDTVWCEPFAGVEEAVAAFTRSPGTQSIEINTRPSMLSIKAKRLIDENFRIYPSIAKIAARLSVTHAHLSRQFKRDLGMSPSKYLHQLRVSDATFRLSLGAEIIDISMDVGYNDLSRFYNQFRKRYGMSPGRCRTAVSRD